jgi:hypothetical protein
MTKSDIATQIIRIKSLQEALENEVKQLRAQLDVGDELVVPEGQVSLNSRTRRDFDENKLLLAVLAQGLDPNTLGSVVLSVDRNKLNTAVTSGLISEDFLEKNSSLYTYDALVIKPNAETKQEGFNKVSSLLGVGK